MEKQIHVTGLTGEREEKDVRKFFVRESIDEKLRELRYKGERPIEGETEKTKKQSEYVASIEEFFGRVFDLLKISHEGNFFSPDQIHFLTKEVFEKHFSEKVSDCGGFFRTIDSSVYMNDNNMPEDSDPNDKEITNIADLTHECVHAVSHLKYLADVGADKSVSVGSYRTGYLVISPEDGARKFNGWNEGVVCITERLILHREAKELKSRFGITEEQLGNVGFGTYLQNQMLVYKLIEKIAEYRKESPSITLTRIIRGQFTGEMIHLRDIEKIFGKDSLDILSRYQSSADPKLNAKRDELIFEYFQTEDLEKREAVKKAILIMKEEKDNVKKARD